LPHLPPLTPSFHYQSTVKIIVKSQSQTSRFRCYTMLEIIAVAMSMSIIVTTLERRLIDVHM